MTWYKPLHKFKTRFVDGLPLSVEQQQSDLVVTVALTSVFCPCSLLPAPSAVGIVQWANDDLRELWRVPDRVVRIRSETVAFLCLPPSLASPETRRQRRITDSRDYWKKRIFKIPLKVVTDSTYAQMLCPYTMPFNGEVFEVFSRWNI